MLQDLYLVEMTEIDKILGMTWLETAFLTVNYGSKTFFFEELKLSRKLPLQNGLLGWPGKISSPISHHNISQTDYFMDIKIVKSGQFDKLN